MKFLYTKDHIIDIVLEILRREEYDLHDNIYLTYDELKEARKEKLQGAYSAVMVTAKNWPDCAQWFREAEEEYFV